MGFSVLSATAVRGAAKACNWGSRQSAAAMQDVSVDEPAVFAYGIETTIKGNDRKRSSPADRCV
jgi:hypothetical protein